MKLGKIGVIVALALILVVPTAHAKTWMDAFDEIMILNRGETEPVGNIYTTFGSTLEMRIVLEDESFQGFFRHSLDTEIITTTKDKTNDPKIKQHINILNQANLQEFEVYIPTNFDKEAAVTGTKVCTDFIVRTTFLGSRLGYDVVGKYIKERNVIVCREVEPTPTPTATPTSSPTPTPTPTATPTIEPSPDATPKSDPVIISLNTNDNFNSTGSGAVAACSKTILGKGIKTVVMAVPVVGMVPIAFSLISMTSAIFTTDRRRPEHWVKVVDAVTGKPVGGAIINILTPDGKVRATWKSDEKTGNAGDLLQPGQYEFVVQKPGFVFPSVEEPMFPLQSGEFVYRSGLVNFNRTNMNTNG